MRARLLLAAIAAAALACGSDKGTRQARSTCDGLVPGQSTLRDAAQVFQMQPVTASCATNYLSSGSGDQCPYDGRSVCIVVVFVSPATANCAAGGGGTCYDRCEARVVGPTFSPDTVICAREFIAGQPLLTGERPPPP